MTFKIKFCGFKDKLHVDFACSLNVDFIGVVFCKSSCRFVDYRHCAEILKDVPDKINKVAVIVDFNDDQIEQILSNCHFDFLQLHGSEDNNRIKYLKNKFDIKIIKAIKVVDESSLRSIDDFVDADYLLFDAKNPGGGKKFDWKLLKNLKTNKGWFLSGGVNIDNLDGAIKQTGVGMVDISSGIEEKRGVKSLKEMKNLMNFIKTTL